MAEQGAVVTMEAAAGNDGRPDAHVLPTPPHDIVYAALNLGHRPDPSCWCQPEVDYEDVWTQGRVYRHKRES